MAGKKNLDDRQIRFLSYYLDPKSGTYNNAFKSALKAGYSKHYAAQIVSLGQDWIQEANRKREGMLVKAERNLEEVLDLDITDQVIGAFGPIVDKKTKKPVMRRIPKLIEIRHDASKFVAETIGKRHYSKKSPLEGDEGENLLTPLAEELKKIADKK